MMNRANVNLSGSTLGKSTIATPSIKPTVPLQSNHISKSEVDNDAVIIQAIGGKPDALAISFVIQERERRIKSRINNRMNELSTLMPSFETQDQKRRALIEFKELKLLELQRKIRNDVVERLRKNVDVEVSSSIETNNSSRRSSRRTTSQVSQQPKSLDSSQHNSRLILDPEQLKRQRHADFLSTITTHHSRFNEHHQNRLKRHKKLCKEIITWHSNTIKRQHMEEEKNQRQRLEALRNENEDEYIKLLKEAKNTRLSELLRQTDEYLDKIGAMLRIQKGKDDIVVMKEAKDKQKNKRSKKKNGDDEQEHEQQEENQQVESVPPQSSSSKEEVGPALSGAENTKKYYTTAHSIEEKVTVQPEMIVGGSLKQYQVCSY